MTEFSLGVYPSKSFWKKFPLLFPPRVLPVSLFVVAGVVGSGVNILNFSFPFSLILIWNNVRSLAVYIQLQIMNSTVFSRRWAISSKTKALSDKLEHTTHSDNLERLALSNKLKPPYLSHNSPLNLDLMPVSPYATIWIILNWWELGLIIFVLSSPHLSCIYKEKARAIITSYVRINTRIHNIRLNRFCIQYLLNHITTYRSKKTGKSPRSQNTKQTRTLHTKDKGNIYFCQVPVKLKSTWIYKLFNI